MKFSLLEGYRFIGRVEGVCGGEPVIVGTRIKPENIVNYGTLKETVEDFELTKEQVEECYKFMRYKNDGDDEDE